MFNIKLSMFLLISAISSASTQALPITNADAFAEGDNKAVLELRTGLVWLDIGVNHEQSFDTVVASLDSQLSEWRLATEMEVLGLWHDLFGDLKDTKDGYGEVELAESDVDYIDSIFSLFIQYQHFPYYLEGRFLTPTGIASAQITNEYASLIKGSMYFSDDIPRYEASTLLVKKERTPVSEPSLLLLFAITFYWLGYLRLNSQASKS
jgi:hypothetical protein